MKKQFLIACAMAIATLLAAPTTGKSQILETSIGGGPFSDASPIDLMVDPCSMESEVQFRFRSAHPASYYQSGKSTPVGGYFWRIRFMLHDITTSTTPKSIDLGWGAQPLDHIENSDIYDLHNTLKTVSTINSEFVFNYTPPIGTGLPDDTYLEFNFSQNVKVGHTYEVEMVIELWHQWLKVWNFDQILATEWSNVIVVNGTTVGGQQANNWNFSTMQPSFTNVSTGDIAGNFSGNQEGYFIGSDNRVYNSVWANNQWNIWCLDPNFTKAAPGAIAVNPNNGEVYFIGTDNNVYNCVWANNKWNIWCLDPFFLKAAPGAITVNPNNGAVYFIGTDNNVYNCVWANNKWNIWCLDQNFGKAAPGAITVNPNNGEVYIVGTDNRVYNCVWANNTWNMWHIDQNFTGAATGGISVCPSSGEVYFIGTNGSLYNCVWANNQWNIWPIGNPNTAAPGAIAAHPDNSHVYFIGVNHILYNAVWSNNTWNIWPINQSYSNEFGTLGLMKKNIGSKQYDMVLTRSEEGNLQNHFWLSCSSEGEGKSNDKAKLAVGEPASISYAEKQMSASTTVVSGIHGERGLEITVSPNPVKDRAIISYGIEARCDFSLNLYDIRGTKVKEYYEKHQQAPGNYNFEIQKGNLPAGLYYLNLETNTGTRQIKKVVFE